MENIRTCSTFSDKLSTCNVGHDVAGEAVN